MVAPNEIGGKETTRPLNPEGVLQAYVTEVEPLQGSAGEYVLLPPISLGATNISSLGDCQAQC
ncbi:MAG TPA: hypothetical protein DCL77_07895 [Prolixibacteraceae bacterium]|nr:hypothetical protein [Prolixibacteraceae bacterium]